MPGPKNQSEFEFECGKFRTRESNYTAGEQYLNY